ncbi:MAG: flagellar biosynthesis protein FlhB [Alphaproteobacteria bacterium]|nr:flagellar biosynthesis protein FlhB [Alphaproteobacteria bacterium]
MASEDDKEDKTEAPSGKRLDDARERGQIPVSRETAMWVELLGVLVVVALVIPPMMRQMADYLRGFIEEAHTFQLDENNVQPLFFQIFGRITLITGVAFGLMVAAVVAGYMIQTGFFYSLELLAPDFSRLLPTNGLKRLFSTDSLVNLGKSFGKLAFLGGIAYAVLKPVAVEAPGYTGLPIEAMLLFLHKKVVHLIEMLLVVFTAIAAVDLFWTRFQYTRNLRMTKVEVKDERKEQEGDPMIKGRLRQMRIERARKRMMAQVPKADVVITNPTHYAVALQYDAKQMAAPVVVAKGINLIAERIREIAEEHRIPLVSNPPLARALHDSVEVDQQIPNQHYRAVAEVISYVYKLRKRKF